MSVRSVKTLQSFYDNLAPDYDLMTGFPDRFAREQKFFKGIVKRYRITTAIDAGCGTGFHALLLSQFGVKVTAVDISRKMILATRKNSREYHLPIRTRQSSFTELSKKIRNRVSALFCMGNSLAHLLTERELVDSLCNFHQVLQPGGILVIQLVNFDRILKEKKALQNERESGGITFRRSYKYHKKSITFIIEIKSGDNKETIKKISVKLNPIRSDELQELLTRTGFSPVDRFGSIAEEYFSPDSSRDLVILAKRHLQ